MDRTGARKWIGLRAALDAAGSRLIATGLMESKTRFASISLWIG